MTQTKPCWPSTESAEQLADRLEALDKAITSPRENAILLAAARKLREQAGLISNAQSERDELRKALDHEVRERNKLFDYAEGLKAAALKAVDDEEELDGGPPAAALMAMQSDPVGFLRAVVRATKGNIRARIEALSSPQLNSKPKDPLYVGDELDAMAADINGESLPASKEPVLGEPVTVPMLPCPFCGNTDIDARFSLAGNGDVAAGCMECGAAGPDARTPQDAAINWNARVEAEFITESPAVNNLPNKETK